MPQKVRVEYSTTLSRDFQSQKIGAAHEFVVDDETQFQEAWNRGFAVVKTAVDLAAGQVTGGAAPTTVVNNVAQQAQGEAPGVVEGDFDAEAAFGPEPEHVRQFRENGPPPPPPPSRAPQPPAPRAQAAPPPPTRPQGVPPPPPPGHSAQQQTQQAPAQQAAPGNLPQLADIVEGEPVYYAGCKVIKNESVPVGNTRKQALFISLMGPGGLPVSGYDGDGKPYQSASASTFDPGVIADMQAIPKGAKVNVWGSWKGWKGNDERIQRGEPPRFELEVEAVQVA